MKTNLKRWIGRVPDVSAVVQRFPVPVVLMTIFTAIIIFLDKTDPKENWIYLLGGLVLSGYVCVAWTIGREGQNKPLHILGQIVMSILICLICWFATSIYFFLPAAIGGVILLLGNSVRRGRDRDDLHVWDFTHKLWTGVVFAVVGSWIFLMGVLAIRFAMNSLFGIDMKWLTEELILPIGLGFLAPLYWMSTIPAVNEDYQELHDNPGFISKAVAFLGTWLLAPLVLIYAAILLAYGVKIILAGTLPKGEIAELTIPFLLIGTLTWLVLAPPFVGNKWLARTFQKLWFWLSVPVTILLGIAIIERVRAYGLTIERILLVLGVIWALGIGLWFSFRPKKYRDIRYIPVFAAALLLVASISAPLISVINQDKRLARFAKKAGIVSSEGQLLKNPVITDMSAAKKAKGALQYLYRHDENKRIRKRLKKWGVDQKADDSKAVYATLGLTNVKNGVRGGSGLNFVNPNTFVAISGFDHMSGILHYYGTNSRERVLAQYEDLTISVKDGSLTGEREAQILFSKNLLAWEQSFPTVDGKYVVNDPFLTLLDNQDEKLVLRLSDLNSYNDENHSWGFYLLSKGLVPKEN